jgi:hypothetical protein
MQRLRISPFQARILRLIRDSPDGWSPHCASSWFALFGKWGGLSGAQRVTLYRSTRRLVANGMIEDNDGWCRLTEKGRAWLLANAPGEVPGEQLPVIERRAEPTLTELADLDLAAPGSQGERTDLGETSTAERSKSGAIPGHDKQTKLRAILRAPELVQDLYRGGLLPQGLAAKLGPKSPTGEQAAKVVQARQGLEKLNPTQDPREFRKKAAAVIRDALGLSGPTALEQVLRLLPRLTAQEEAALLERLQERRPS